MSNKKKTIIAIQNSHLGSGKLFTKLSHDLGLEGLTAQEVAEVLINNDREGLNAKRNNEHTDDTVT